DISCIVFFFFFQAEDGIRDYKVTGVQTCALPISWPCMISWSSSVMEYGFSPPWRSRGASISRAIKSSAESSTLGEEFSFLAYARSEERRVGKECIYGVWAEL